MSGPPNRVLVIRRGANVESNAARVGLRGSGIVRQILELLERLDVTGSAVALVLLVGSGAVDSTWTATERAGRWHVSGPL